MQGGIPKFSVMRSDDVLRLMPDDGTPIRFKDLKAKCKDSKISYRIMLKELKRLEDTGMILREAVVAKRGERGVGTQYKLRDIAYSTGFNDPIGALTATIRDSKSFLKRMELFGKNQYEIQMEAARNLNYALDLLKLSILEELYYCELYNIDNKELADKEFNSALKDKIFPLIMRLRELVGSQGTGNFDNLPPTEGERIRAMAVIDAACGERAMAIMDELTKEAWFKYGRKWDEINTMSDHPDYPFK
jgi:hypothetical protein